MLEIDIIKAELERRKDRLKFALQNNPNFGATRSNFNAMISAYEGMLAFLDHTFDTRKKLVVSDKQEDNVLNGWLSKTEGNCVCIHFTEECPEKIGNEWFGDDRDTVLEYDRIPGITVPDEPVKVEITFKSK